MGKCVHAGHRQRLKQQFLDHGEMLEIHQLMELLLFYAIPQSDTNELAHKLLNEFGGLAGVLDAYPETLMRVKGISEHTVVLFKLIPKLFGRYMAEKNDTGLIITSTARAANYLRRYFHQGVRNEMTYLLCMDASHKVLGVRKLSEGSVSAADILPRRVVEIILSLNAVSVILAHNHPSGIALPSNADIAVTRHLCTILREIEVHLEDHLIFADNSMDATILRQDYSAAKMDDALDQEHHCAGAECAQRNGLSAMEDFGGKLISVMPDEVARYDDVVSMRESGLLTGYLW